MKKANIAFIVVLSFGFLISTVGLILIINSLGQSFSINNLQPAFALFAGFFLFIAGVIMTSLCLRIRWMQRVEKKLDKALENSLENDSNDKEQV